MGEIARRRKAFLSVFICTTIHKGFLRVRKFLPQRNAKNTKRSFSVSAISAFFCGYHFRLRRQPRQVYLWF